MVTTKHCCWGDCKSDSRIGTPSNVFFIGFGNGFPKPDRDREKCLRWVANCGRQFFSIKNVNKDTYICSLHFLGGNGPTEENPDPLKCGKEVTRKRKSPSLRPDYKSPKQMRLERTEAAEALLLLPNNPDPDVGIGPLSSAKDKDQEAKDTDQEAKDTDQEAKDTDQEEHLKTDIGIMCKPCTETQGCQTEASFTSEVVKLSIHNKLLENQLLAKTNGVEIKQPSIKQNTTTRTTPQFQDNLDVDVLKDDDKAFKFYTGLTFAQFMCLWNFLGDATKKINYWNSGITNPDKTPSKRPGRQRKLTPMNELLLTLIRLRLGLVHQDLAYRFRTNTRQVSTCILTWVQLLYKQFMSLKTVMFATRQKIRKHLPKSFKKYKNIRCIIDCTEVQVQQPGNLAAAGNQYSSYKGHPTYKFLVAVAPNGAIMYISDAFEGSISDVDIVRKSGFLDFLHPGDVIMADRGFLIEDMLNERHVKLVRPQCFGSRQNFTPQEEAATQDIAKPSIHVERSIERMKKFKILRRIIPQKLQPVFSQCVFVIGCLVNFQTPLFK